MKMAPLKDPVAEKPQASVPEKLYADYVRIYPKKIKGTFRSLKTWAGVLLLAVYFLAPFLRWDRGPGAPDQAILIDMPGRRAYFFFIEIWPQEVYYLTGILIIAAILLFFTSSLFGRLWCGYACWQTVFTDLFLYVERLWQGDRNARIKLDRAPWSVNKLVRKAGTHATWLVISAAVGLAFTLYFYDVFDTPEMLFGDDPAWGAWTFIAIIGGFCYLLAGWAREQVCIYMCPYARFQGAMFDDNSLLVTYEAWRGEPRGPLKGNRSFENRGHCVDCKMCVHVCPTGIDIRNGQQLECIGCALCVDACNSVMDRFGLPRGLITWDSANNQLARSRGETTKLRLVRVRTVIYMVVLALVSGVMVYGLSSRATTDVNVLHDRSPLFVPLSDGSIRNGYTFKILNMVREDHAYGLKVAGIEGAGMTVIGVHEGEPAGEVELKVEPDSVGSFQVFVTAPRDSIEDERMDLEFVLTDRQTGETIVHESWFAGPKR